MAEEEVDNLTMEQYLALTRGNQTPGVVKPEIGGNVNFEIKSQFMRELREDTFSGNKNDDAHEHVERELSIPRSSLKKPLSKGTVHHPKPPISLKKSATSSKKETRHYTKPGNESTSNKTEGMAAIVNKLENLGRDMKKLKESVHAIQVGYQNCEGVHLDKDCPLNEEVKSIEEAKYGEFRCPLPFSNEAKYRVGPLGYYTRIDNRQPFGEKKPTLEELMNKHLEESTQRRAEMEE
ncbi:hypothetical protein Tco_0013749 [Tanacetum coccineum]